MGVYEGRGTLSKAISQLEARWREARSNWDDSRTDEFEEKYLVNLKSDLGMAVSAMDNVAALLSRIKSECA